METKFVNGLRVFPPHPNSPEWVKFGGIINKKDMIEWLKTQPDEVRLQVKQSKKGGYYAEIDTWEPSK